MSSVPENDYIDARLAAADAIRTADAKLYQAKTDARFDKVDARFDRVDARFDRVDSRFDKVGARFDGVDARFDFLESAVRMGFESIREQMAVDRQRTDEKLAHLEVRMDAKFSTFQSEIIKWMAATVLAGVTISVSVNVYLFNTSKTQPAFSAPAAPLVLYIQPSMEAAIARLPLPPSSTQDKKK
ncbi:hypothetical protein HSX11_09050 [Oxalobacteraceae bacterium]|nr:hypothetical protein [Oxalobacteraceae bacterium]